MSDKDRYESAYENQWCPGCGNFGILGAMKDALAQLNIPPEKLLIVSGIGQAAKTPHFLKCNFLHGIHGRALSIALGAKLANHDLNILVNSGDGDCYGEGGNHFIHAARRNTDMTLLVHNNQIYGLTKGQASPTSAWGMTTAMQPGGVISEPLNGPALALTMGAGFVARGFSGNKEHLSGLIQAAVQYKGFSVIDIFQPCVTFNRVNTAQWYKDRIYELDETKDRDDFGTAMTLARETGDRIPVGILYTKEKKEFISQIKGLEKGPLIDRHYDPDRLEKVVQEYI
ncbi:2-oxoacid ferredoxin oxidoreductase [Desulfobacter hydrogenophilus]|uniref:2-oxoacid ferredoxin oxidoreductase n=1 Tax=Desulfobacter hydrogenophilus TaxID=2291 RepID=A0A328FKU7_9BACT|nr:thiamine pyrophosphate-dependent enzyme [Desulfobacter hydrogenophilus]NDY70644.1 2-oxoacid ferredoxin oxidoreductase [Desulfobacter hydrogenophilus]QBH14008.1 2-oxoacid ferredoxin oxidoreductase [Desulfobacter hydrogenophilus]RAM03575.1 2-oxoacid ferredoxin oxidoreductase [Desulfobacter hydrogenophilus]